MSLFHWIIVLVVVMVLFGAGKIPRLAEDVAKGIKAFRHGMREDEKPADPKELNSSDPSVKP